MNAQIVEMDGNNVEELYGCFGGIGDRPPKISEQLTGGGPSQIEDRSEELRPVHIVR